MLDVLIKIKKPYKTIRALSKVQKEHKNIHSIITYNKFDRLDRGGVNSPNFKIAKDLKKIGVQKVTLFSPHSNESINHYKTIFGDKLEVVELANLLDRFIDFSIDHNYMIGAPDGGCKLSDRAVKRAEILAKNIFKEDYEDKIFYISKKRLKHNNLNVKVLKGDIKYKNIILIDDIIDTGNTAIEAAKNLKAGGCKDIILVVSHGVFSKSIDYVLDHNLFKQIIVTDSTNISDPRITILPTDLIFKENCFTSFQEETVI